MDYVDDGETIVLKKDVTLEWKTGVGKRYSITIDLNGYTLKAEKLVLEVSKGGTLTIKDSSLNKTGRIEAYAIPKNEYVEEYDLNKDNYVGTQDLDKLLYYYNETTSSEDWEEAKVCDINQNGAINVEDLSRFLENARYTEGLAIFNKGTLIIEGMTEKQFYGEPVAIHDSLETGGTTTWNLE